LFGYYRGVGGNCQELGAGILWNLAKKVRNFGIFLRFIAV